MRHSAATLRLMAGSVGESIKRARRAKGLSQEELASLVRVSRRTVGEWERTGNVPENRLSAVREVLGDDAVSPGEDWPGESTTPTPPPASAEMTFIGDRGLRVTITLAPGQRMADLAPHMPEVMEAVAKVMDELDGTPRPESGSAGQG